MQLADKDLMTMGIDPSYLHRCECDSCRWGARPSKPNRRDYHCITYTDIHATLIVAYDVEGSETCSSTCATGSASGSACGSDLASSFLGGLPPAATLYTRNSSRAPLSNDSALAARAAMPAAGRCHMNTVNASAMPAEGAAA